MRYKFFDCKKDGCKIGNTQIIFDDWAQITICDSWSIFNDECSFFLVLGHNIPALKMVNESEFCYSTPQKLQKVTISPLNLKSSQELQYAKSLKTTKISKVKFMNLKAYQDSILINTFTTKINPKND